MANYCYNTIDFIATEDHLLDLEFLHTNIMSAYLDKDNHYSCNYILGAISKQYGSKEYKFDGRDNISWISDEISYDSIYETYYFTIDIESAWSPVLGRIEIWIDSINPNIWTVGIAEEPGFEIYINTDVVGNYYSIRYIYYDDKNEVYIYQDDLEDLVENLKSSYPEAKDKLDAIEVHTLEAIQSVMNEVLPEDNTVIIYQYDEESCDTFDD